MSVAGLQTGGGRMGLAHWTPCPPAATPKPFPPGKVPSGSTAFKSGFVLTGLVHPGPRFAVWSSKGGREWP